MLGCKGPGGAGPPHMLRYGAPGETRLSRVLGCAGSGGIGPTRVLRRADLGVMGAIPCTGPEVMGLSHVLGCVVPGDHGVVPRAKMHTPACYGRVTRGNYTPNCKPRDLQQPPAPSWPGTSLSCCLGPWEETAPTLSH